MGGRTRAVPLSKRGRARRTRKFRFSRRIVRPERFTSLKKKGGKKGAERSANSPRDTTRLELFLSRTMQKERESRERQSMGVDLIKIKKYMYKNEGKEGECGRRPLSIDNFLFKFSLFVNGNARLWCFALVYGKGGLFIDFLVARASYITRRVLWPLPRDKSARCSRRQSLFSLSLSLSRRSFHRPFRNFDG